APRKAEPTETIAPCPPAHHRPATIIKTTAAVPVTKAMGTSKGAVTKYATNNTANKGKAARNTSGSRIAARGASSASTSYVLGISRRKANHNTNSVASTDTKLTGTITAA